MDFDLALSIAPHFRFDMTQAKGQVATIIDQLYPGINKGFTMLRLTGDGSPYLSKTSIKE